MRDIYSEVIGFLQEHIEFDPKEVTGETQLIADLGLDSLGLIEVADSAEQQFGFFIEDEDLMNIKTINDIVGVIEKYNR